MLSLSPDRLHAIARRVMEAIGSAPAEAAVVADHLVAANLAGHDSHGIGMLPDYVRMREEGLLVPNRELRMIRDLGAVLHVDGGRGFGQVMARDAMRLAIGKVPAMGAVVVGLRNASHVGRVGTYAEQCAEAGLVSIHFVNVGDHAPHQAPWGAGDARLGTNPFAAGVPLGGGAPPVILDMATSAIAFGKARVARNKGLPVPEGTVIDAAGRPTTDPTALVDRMEGALRAFGLHKGSGLAVLCELLGGALTGGMTMQPARPRDGGIVNSMLSVVIDPAAFGEPAAIAAEVAAIGRWIKAAPLADGFDSILLPGEPEGLAREVRTHGVPVDPKTLADIVEAATRLGVDRQEMERLTAADPQ